jgi:hypothetical protein
VTAFTVAGAVLHGWWGDLPAAWLTGMTVGLVGNGLAGMTRRDDNSPVGHPRSQAWMTPSSMKSVIFGMNTSSAIVLSSP